MIKACIATLIYLFLPDQSTKRISLLGMPSRPLAAHHLDRNYGQNFDSCSRFNTSHSLILSFVYIHLLVISCTFALYIIFSIIRRAVFRYHLRAIGGRSNVHNDCK